jgi:outer membrane lipoprotein-sorting protein
MLIQFSFSKHRLESEIPINPATKENMKVQTCLAAFAVILFLASLTLAALADNSPADLPAADILQNAAKKYAGLTSYSDEGSSSAMLGKINASSNTFTIKLARTNLYQVAWWQDGEIYMPKGVVWSAGDGDYLWMGKNFTPRKSESMEMALAGATGISGGAAASIPGTFFKMNWGGQLGLAVKDARRKADEKIDGIDCYVLTHGTDGRTNIMWIGRSDLLIHQIENDTSGGLLKKIMEEQAKNNPQIRAMLDASGTQLFQDSKIVETHRNIISNPSMSKTDFDFHAPAAVKP